MTTRGRTDEGQPIMKWGEMCHCGMPLHYSDPAVEQMVRKLIAAKGPNIVVTNAEGRSWRVPRHYIALHGLRAEDLPNLGFQETKVLLRKRPGDRTFRAEGT